VHLALSRIIRTLYPDLVSPSPSAGLVELADAGRLAAAVVAAGFSNPTITEVTHDFRLNVGGPGDIDRLFEFVPHWSRLDATQCAAVARAFASQVERGRGGDIFPIPSTALIATARRPPA
jgi:hypothetical protein